MGKISFLDSFDAARAAATKHEPGLTKYKHIAIIVTRKGQLIATGRNYNAGESVETDEGLLFRTVHAEINALSKVNIRRLDDASLISFGQTRASIILARPCLNCFTVLKKLQFKRCFYSLPSALDAPIWQEELF